MITELHVLIFSLVVLFFQSGSCSAPNIQVSGIFKDECPTKMDSYIMIIEEKITRSQIECVMFCQRDFRCSGVEYSDNVCHLLEVYENCYHRATPRINGKTYLELKTLVLQVVMPDAYKGGEWQEPEMCPQGSGAHGFFFWVRRKLTL